LSCSANLGTPSVLIKTRTKLVLQGEVARCVTAFWTKKN
jgi:hypothetical protein